MPDVNINNFHDVMADMGAYVLLDVRTKQEYREGHLPGSMNIPLMRIDETEEMVENKDMPILVYCHSGARSAQAAALLSELGYANVKNLGGIAAYTGRVEL